MTMVFNSKKCARALADVQSGIVRELLELKGMVA